MRSLGFEFKYPKDWDFKVIEQEEWLNIWQTDFNGRFYYNKNENEKNEDEKLVITLAAWMNVEGKTPREWQNSKIGSLPNIEKEEKFVLNGSNVYFVKSKSIKKITDKNHRVQYQYTFSSEKKIVYISTVEEVRDSLEKEKKFTEVEYEKILEDFRKIVYSMKIK